jgi:hypothetical protein
VEWLKVKAMSSSPSTEKTKLQPGVVEEIAGFLDTLHISENVFDKNGGLCRGIVNLIRFIITFSFLDINKDYLIKMEYPSDSAVIFPGTPQACGNPPSPYTNSSRKQV